MSDPLATWLVEVAPIKEQVFLSVLTYAYSAPVKV